MEKTSLCHYGRFTPSEILLPTPHHWRWAAALISQGCCLWRISEPCAGRARGRVCGMQTQVVQALYQVTVFPGRMISRTQVCCSSCAKRLIYPCEISQGNTSSLGGNDCPACRGECSFMCSAASALGQAWKWIRWLQGDKFWHPGVLLPSLDNSALSCISLPRALSEMCVSARAASVWSHGDVDEQLALTYSMSLLLSVCKF